MSLFVPICDHQITAQIICLSFTGKDCSDFVFCWVPGNACVALYKAPNTFARGTAANVAIPCDETRDIGFLRGTSRAMYAAWRGEWANSQERAARCNTKILLRGRNYSNTSPQWPHTSDATPCGRSDAHLTV
jgi:hypothetical protein